MRYNLLLATALVVGLSTTLSSRSYADVVLVQVVDDGFFIGETQFLSLNGTLSTSDDTYSNVTVTTTGTVGTANLSIDVTALRPFNLSTGFSSNLQVTVFRSDALIGGFDAINSVIGFTSQPVTVGLQGATITNYADITNTGSQSQTGEIATFLLGGTELPPGSPNNILTPFNFSGPFSEVATFNIHSTAPINIDLTDAFSGAPFGPTAVPEPAMIAMLGLGFLGLCAIRRSRATLRLSGNRSGGLSLILGFLDG